MLGTFRIRVATVATVYDEAISRLVLLFVNTHFQTRPRVLALT